MGKNYLLNILSGGLCFLSLSAKIILTFMEIALSFDEGFYRCYMLLVRLIENNKFH